MNILFSAHIRNNDHLKNCKIILNLLSSTKNRLTVFFEDNKNKYGDTFSDQYDIIDDLDIDETRGYDLILAFNKVGVKQLKSLVDKSNIPIVYMINACDIEEEYPDDPGQYSKVILLNLPIDFPAMSLTKDFVVPLRLPLVVFEANDFEIKNKKKPKILIDIESRNLQFSPLYRLIPLLNTLVNFEIKFFSENVLMSDMFNPNISLQKKRKTNVDASIEESDIIIGSGAVIQQAITQCKPCIVAGEKGYGGIMNPDSFELQYINNFQGRIGGVLNEYIPEKLVMEDILDLLEWDDERVNRIVQGNWQLLKKENDQVRKKFDGLIDTIVEEYRLLNERIEKATLRLSTAFLIVPFSEEKLTLINSRTRKVHSQIEKEEAEIINLFKQGCMVKEALLKSGYEDEQEMFNNFISELVNEKILVLDGS